MEAYEEVKDIIKKKGNTATVIKQREKAWQSIADRLNALNMNGPKRTWQQVKIKYKNILQNVSGSTVFLLEPPAQAPDDADPGESPSAAATAHDGDDDEEETISVDSRRHEDPDAIQWENQPGNIVRINKRTPHPAKFQLR
ncbi:hypothetical protein cypCar_00032881 [Cyprinus carpio]|nr:hypothetical protein cypCar_00032881 [Cyprinus carpio]